MSKVEILSQPPRKVIGYVEKEFGSESRFHCTNESLRLTGYETLSKNSYQTRRNSLGRVLKS